MKHKLMTRIFALVPVTGVVAVTLSLSMPSVSSAAGRSGALHVTKECSQYTGAAASFCTITSSNLAEIKVGSKVYYELDNTANLAAGFFDSPVVLDAGNNNRAVGRCTLDAAFTFGLCTFSDGIGRFAGFQARIDVTPFTSSPTEINYHWDGRYSFGGNGLTVAITGPGGATSTTNSFQAFSNLITLDASTSVSSNAGALTYSWTVSPGNPPATMAGWNTAAPAIQLTFRGTYQFTVTVTDATGATATATVTVRYA